MGSIVTTVGQGHLRPRTLDAAHDHVVGADVSVPVPGFLGKKKGISHTRQCLEDCWGNIHPPVTCFAPPAKTNPRANTIKEMDVAKGCWKRVVQGINLSLFKQNVKTGIKTQANHVPCPDHLTSVKQISLLFSELV